MAACPIRKDSDECPRGCKGFQCRYREELATEKKRAYTNKYRTLQEQVERQFLLITNQVKELQKHGMHRGATLIVGASTLAKYGAELAAIAGQMQQLEHMEDE